MTAVALEILQNVRTQMAAGNWCKNTWVQYVPIADPAEAGGLPAEIEVGWGNQAPVYYKVLCCLQSALARESLKREGPHGGPAGNQATWALWLSLPPGFDKSIPRFNDHSATELKDVLEVLDLAIVQVQKLPPAVGV
jgi:hypothetical protein